jgi:tetratricopeptide (TPR) repeat protein
MHTLGAPDHDHPPPVPEIPHLAPDAPHAPPAVHVSARDRFGRLLIGLVVTATFLGAAVAALHSYSLSRANRAGLTAQAYGARMTGEFLKRQEEGHTRLLWAAQAEDARTAMINLRHRQILRQLGMLPVSLGQSDDQAGDIHRLEAIAQHLDQASGLTPGSAESPQRDPNFPAQFMVRGTRAAYQRAWHIAIQDAYNDLSVAWRVRAGWYTACVTTYAVAVYLLSLAIVMNNRAGGHVLRGEAGWPSIAAGRPPAARLFSAIAAGLMLGATTAALAAAITSPRETTAVRMGQLAAKEYADGVQTMALASTADEYKAAAGHFRLALSARPNLAYAHSSLATALFLQGSPQAVERFASMTDPVTLREAQRSAEAAWRRGMRRGALLVDLGWNALLAGLESPEPSGRRLIEASVSYGEEAARRDPDDSVAFSNLGLATLLLGRLDESERHYDAALHRSRFASADASVRRSETDLRDRIVSSLTDLELARAFRPDLTDAIDRRKAWIVKRGWPDTADAYSSRAVRLRDVTVAISSTDARWSAPVEQVNPKDDVLVAIWYLHREYRPGKWVWHALPTLSGKVESDAHGGWRHSRDYATTPYQCLQSGRYKVELYVNGRLAGQGEGSVVLPDLGHHEFPDLSIRLCHPRDWVPSRKALAGVVQGFQAVDDARAVHLFRLRHPWGEARARAAVETYVGWAFGHLGLRGVRRTTISEGTPFLGPGFTLTYTRQALYTYAGGRARVGVGVSSLGSVVIGVVSGPGTSADESLAKAILDSVR